MTKLLLVGSHHGHERLGDYLWSHIRTKRAELLPHLEYKIANPRAKAANMRFIESDMNRSYNNGSSTYEERRAAEFLAEVKVGGYNFVLDFHTTTVTGEPIIITANLDESTAFIAASSFGKVILMPPIIAGTSFIGHYPRSVSIEVNEDDAKTVATLNQICDDIERYLRSETTDNNKEYFQVTEYLTGQDVTAAEARTIQNFTKFRDSFYPVLAGEQSYDPAKYLGFKAQKIA
jgi:succinylglutamate desuccinylase